MPYSSEGHDDFGEKDITIEINSGHATVKICAMCNITDEVAASIGKYITLRNISLAVFSITVCCSWMSQFLVKMISDVT